DRVLAKNMENNNHFFIFSNDIDWCKHNLVPLMKGNNVHFVTENKGVDSCWDMFLMTYCKKLIIANSSFSWWGAFLNKNVELVIAPYPWLNRKCDIDIYDSSWELIE
ncbi:MAG: alpha-1,2-fucosyltransferase, partial [Muribaculaceae bacterium]|nr:alpha-1,2-fucosyltransferase [Muribaculaceae bacterium]